MTAGVVALPKFSERVLASYVPDLQVHVGEGDGGYILADCRYGFEFWGGVGREEEGFHLFVEGGFAGIIETEKEH